MASLYQEMVFRAPQPRIDESNTVVIPDTIAARFAVAVQNFIGAYYVYVFIALAWAGLAAFALAVFHVPRWRLTDGLITILILVGGTILIRIVFFSFLDATWWMGGYERYLFPVMPLASCFLALLIHEAIALCRKHTLSNVRPK
jgi:hypothetical protein